MVNLESFCGVFFTLSVYGEERIENNLEGSDGDLLEALP
jgi:hypothetical protein